MSLRDYLFHEEPGITLYCGDSLDVLPLIVDQLCFDPVDLVLTDPPYNVGKEYGALTDDDRDASVYARWCSFWFPMCRAIAKRVMVFPGHGNLSLWWELAKPSGVGCWYKPGNPAGGGVFQFCEWEPLLLWGHGVGGSDVFRATVNRQAGLGGHPCPKPLDLFAQIIRRTKAAEVIDPFCGSGTTLEAAKNLGRRAIGIEIEPRYCEIAVKRLRQEVLAL